MLVLEAGRVNSVWRGIEVAEGLRVRAERADTGVVLRREGSSLYRSRAVRGTEGGGGGEGRCREGVRPLVRMAR